MIRRVSEKTAEWLLRAGAIPASDKDLYGYGTYCVLFTMAPVALVLVVSAFLHMISEGLLLILPFMLIRKFSGGFHFQSPVPCLAVSTALLTVFLLGIRAVLHTGQYGGFTAALFASLIVVGKFSPIDSEGRRLSQVEKKVFKRIAAALAGATTLACCLLACLHCPQTVVPLGAGLILTATLQAPCIFTHRVPARPDPHDAPQIPEGSSK